MLLETCESTTNLGIGSHGRTRCDVRSCVLKQERRAVRIIRFCTGTRVERYRSYKADY